MSAQNNPSQHITTGSQAAPRTTFGTYEEYAEQASQMWQEMSGRSRVPDKELWLAQFPANGQAMQWYSLSDDPKLSPDQFEDVGRGLRRTRSKNLFRSQLQAPTHLVTCQILIFLCQYDYLVAEVGVGSWHDEPLNWFIEVVGLALDMPLNIWDHVRSRLEGKRSYFSPLPVPWVENCSMLDIGQYSIVALENSSQNRPPTGTSAFLIRYGRRLILVSKLWRSCPSLYTRKNSIVWTGGSKPRSRLAANTSHHCHTIRPQR